jgi:hypothetical protein
MGVEWIIDRVEIHGYGFEYAKEHLTSSSLKDGSPKISRSRYTLLPFPRLGV